MISIASKTKIAYSLIALLIIITGFVQSWATAFAILNLCIISAVMALGVNIQWGFAGLFSAGTMGFAALGGVAAVLVAKEPVTQAWAVSSGVWIALIIVVITTALVWLIIKKTPKNSLRTVSILFVLILGYFLARHYYTTGTLAIESIDPSKTGFLGGLGLPIIFSWLVGGMFAAAAAWLIGKTTLSLRTDYLAIATLGISEIIISFIKNEDWLTRGVKNVTGLPRPVPYEIELQNNPNFIALVENLYADSLAKATDYSQSLQLFLAETSNIVVKLSYTGLFLTVLILLIYLSSLALKSPWGRMIRAIRDNEVAAEAMGKDVKLRRLQVLILGSMVIGIAGAMLTTLEGQLTPTSYTPMRFTFLIWVMVIVGGSGNNHGTVIGSFVVWFFWIQSEPLGMALIDFLTSFMDENNPLRLHLLQSAVYMRLIVMGTILILIMRYSPKGILPETYQKTVTSPKA